MAWIGMIALLAASMVSPTEAEQNLQHYPEAEAGMVRYVFLPPPQEDESNFKLEIIAGKTVLLDEVNHYGFGGRLEEQTLEGFGFPMFKLPELGPLAGTLIAVDPEQPKVERFVPLRSEPFLIRYNSRLPVVVYVPEGVQVRYRIWSAEPEATAMEQR